MKSPAFIMRPGNGLLFNVAGMSATRARAWRSLAKDYRGYAKQGIEPKANVRQALRCEAEARKEEAKVRELADACIRI